PKGLGEPSGWPKLAQPEPPASRVWRRHSAYAASPTIDCAFGICPGRNLNAASSTSNARMAATHVANAPRCRLVPTALASTILAPEPRLVRGLPRRPRQHSAALVHVRVRRRIEEARQRIPHGLRREAP